MSRGIQRFLSLFLLLGASAPLSAAGPEVLPDPDVALLGSPFISLIHPRADGSLVVGGNFVSVDSQQQAGLALLHADGSFDPSWTVGSEGGDVLLGAEGPDGRLYVAGRFSSIGGEDLPFLARLDPVTGVVDPEWRPQLDPAPPGGGSVTAVVFDEDGHVYVAQSPSGVHRLSLADGSRDPTFELSTTGLVHTLAVDRAADVLLVGGSLNSGGPAGARGLWKASAATGAFDDAWKPLASFGDSAERVLLDGTGHAIVVGDFDSIGGVATDSIARVSLASGLADPQWSFEVDGRVTSLAHTSGGDYLLAGMFSTIDGAPRPDGVARISASGGLSAWAPNAGTSPALVDTIVEHDGMVLLPRYAEGNRTGRLLRLRMDNAADAPLADPAEFLSPGGLSLLLQDAAGGTLLLGNNFAADSQRSFGVHRLDAGLALDPSFDSGLLASMETFLSISKGAVGGSGVFVSGIGGVDVRWRGVLRLDRTSGAEDLSWQPLSNQAANPAVSAIAADPAGDYLYIAGNFEVDASGTRYRLARFDAAGSGAHDTAWNPPADATATRLLVHDGFLYLAGSFSTFGGMDLPRLLRIDLASGNVDPAWRPAPTLVPGMLVVHEGFLYTGDVRRYSLADGSLDAWDPLRGRSAFAAAMSVSPIDGSLHYVGSFDSGCAGAPLMALRVPANSERFDEHWSVATDTQFGLAGVHATAAGVVVGGLFASVNGVPRRNIAALGPSPSIFSDGMGDPAGCVQQ